MKSSPKHFLFALILASALIGIFYAIQKDDSISSPQTKTPADSATLSPQTSSANVSVSASEASSSASSTQHSSSSIPEFQKSESPSAGSTSSKAPFIPRNFISAREHKIPTLKQYSMQIPRLFSDSSMFANGARYMSMTIEWYREKMQEGDVAAKFYYSNKLMVTLSKELYEDNLAKSGMIDVDYWKRRHEELLKLMIECATQGINFSASNIIFTPSNDKLRDPIDSMAWALIADAMERERDIFLTMVCLDPQWENQCSAANLSDATHRALMMIDLYGFKTIN